MTDILTVQGISGDLTSHGWMQGVFSPLPNYRRIHNIQIQLRVLSGDIIIQTQRRAQKSPHSDSAAGCICSEPQHASSQHIQQRELPPVRAQITLKLT